MQVLIDFLSFRLLISPALLLISYYLGALGLPVASWWFAGWLLRKHPILSGVYEAGKVQITQQIPGKYRWKLYLLFFFCFLSMEIMWRMMFEFMIAYFQIRDALLLPLLT